MDKKRVADSTFIPVPHHRRGGGGHRQRQQQRRRPEPRGPGCRYRAPHPLRGGAGGLCRLLLLLQEEQWTQPGATQGPRLWIGAGLYLPQILS